MSSVCYRTDSFALPSSVCIDRIQGVPIGLRRPERRLDWPLRGPPVAKIVMARYLANTYPSYEKYLEVSGVDISEASLIQPLKKKFEAKFHAGVNQVLDHQPPRATDPGVLDLHRATEESRTCAIELRWRPGTKARASNFLKRPSSTSRAARPT